MRPTTTEHAEIVVVATDTTIRQQVVRILQEDGYAVRDVGGASDALVALGVLIPDLLVVALDFVDARELLAALQSHPVRGSMAVLALDAAAECGRLLDIGADDAVALPLNSNALRVAARAVLRLKFGERATRSLVSQKSREQQVLHRAGLRLAAARTVNETYTITAEVVRANLGYDRVNIVLHDVALNTLVSVISTDGQGRVYSPDQTPVSVNVAPKSPLLELPAYQAILVNGHDTFYIPDSSGRAPQYFRPFMDGPVGETLLVALRSDDRVEGILTVDNALSGRAFGPEGAGMLVALARQVGMAMARTRVAAELEARTRDAELLAAAGARLASVLEPPRVHEMVLDQVAMLMPLDHALMLICDGAWARYVAGRGADQLHPGTPVVDLEGACGAAIAAQGGGPLYVPDVTISSVWHDFPLWAGEQRIHSLIVAPLMQDDVMLACLCISSFSAAAYSERQVALASIFTERSAQALINARLYRAAVDGSAGTAASERQGSGDGIALQSEPDEAPAIAFQHDEDLELAELSDAANTGRQEQVVDNLRLLSLLDAGTLNLMAQSVGIRGLVDRAINVASESVRERHISRHGNDDLLAVVDADRTIEIVGNLLDNAARYSSQGSPITVVWSVEDDKVVVRVQDRGQGIATQHRRYLFTRFGWLPGTSGRRSPKGIGLGLYLARSVAEAMGGSLDLEASSAKGSLFRLTLPLPPD